MWAFWVSLVVLSALTTEVASLAAPTCGSVSENKCMPAAASLKTTRDPTVTAASCCALCQANTLCGGFTFRAGGKKNNATCFEHPIATLTPEAGDCTSGILRQPAPTPAPVPAPANAKNVLFLISDDLRPEIFAFGEKMMHTPNLDKLAESSMVFTRAYCQQAICGPTRNSFLSGRRPQRTQSWNFKNWFRQSSEPGAAEWKSFPQWFKEHGYLTLGGGKTYHPGLPPNNDAPYSWSEDRPYVNNGDVKCNNSYANPSRNVCPDDTPDLMAFSDYANLQGMIDDLDFALGRGPNATAAGEQNKKKPKQPFFLAYGIHKPHLPWHMPKKFWDLYDTAEIDLPTHEAAPEGMPPIAFTYECDGQTSMSAFGEQHPIPYPNASFPGHGENVAFPNNFTRTLRRGYYASVSWVDYLVGEMVDALEKRGVADDTVVALVGDHGWQLGEHNIWGKHTNFELGTRVPLLIKDPSKSGGRSTALVESVDIYPTVAALAGLPPPPDLDGTSLEPLWPGVSSAEGVAAFRDAKPYAYSEYPRCPKDWTQPWTDTTSCVKTDRTNFTSMGYSVRSDAYRYTVWTPWDGAKLVGRFDVPDYGVELYAHAAGKDEPDMNVAENVNLAKDPKYAQVIAQHHAAAIAHWSKK